MRPQTYLILASATGALLFASAGHAQVTMVEPGHVLIQRMDTIANPAQAIVEQMTPGSDIESICVDRGTGDVYFQLIFPPVTPTSTTSHIYRLGPGGAVVPIAINTGFAIAENGTDLHIDYQRNLLVTQDQGAPPATPTRLASVGMAAPFPLGTWSLLVPPLTPPGTLGMDFSNGNGAGGIPSIIPPGNIVFTGDAVWDGIHEAFFAGPAQITHVPPPLPPIVVNPPQPPAGPGDDLVNQPDGDWIWFGDVNRTIIQFLPYPPFLATNSGLSVSTAFASNPVPHPFSYGTRAAVCDITGDMYFTCSGGNGGSALFRLDEQLTTATLVLTVGTLLPTGAPNQGIHDLELGPASFAPGFNSVYFTVHDYVTGGEQIWEVSATACCPVPASATVIPDGFGANVPMSIAAFPPGNQPKLGNATFAVQLDDPTMACALTPGGTSTFLVLAAGPASLFPVGGFGCVPGGPGELMVGPFISSPTVVLWPGPGVGAVHPLPIPFLTSLCGAPVSLQGLFLDPARVPSPFALTWRLDLVLGS